MSFSQALSGLNAQQQSLGVIGNNIANSQTVGFKSSGVQFSDVFANSRVGLGTRVSAVLQNFNEGNVESTNRSLDLAISGTGFYRFEQGGEVVYSRNGQLSLTADGFLQNAQGARLMGYLYNEATGAVAVGGQPDVLQVNSDELEANATTSVSTTLNLDSREQPGQKLNTAMVRDAAGAQQEIDYHYSNNFTVFDSLGNPINATVYFEKVGGPTGQNVWQAKVAADGVYDPDNDFTLEFTSSGLLAGVRETTDGYRDAQESYLSAQSDLQSAQSTRDAADTVLEERTAAVAEAQAKLDEITAAGGDTTEAQAALTAAQAAESTANTELAAAEADLATAQTAFNTAEGAWLAAYNAQPVGNQASITFDVDTGAEAISFNYDPRGTTQFGNTSSTSALTQNGYTSGALVGITIEDDGTVMRNYANEQSRPAGQIALANFRNPEGLRPEGDNAWVATQASGQELVGAPGTGQLGLIVSGAVETSNVDMARELVNMIVSQRAYQANSQTIKTQDELLQTVINLR